MRHLTFALMLPSSIHTAGLTAILRRFPESGCGIVDVNPGDYMHDIAKLHPSLLIADPSTPMIDWELLKSTSSQPMKIISLLSHQLPKKMLKFFDDTISVYDSPEEIIEIVKRNVASDDSGDKSRDLSPREKEVVVGIVKGLSNKEIASSMNVSINTVMTHRRNIASKLHIHTPAGLTIYAIVSNLVKLEDIKADMDKL